MSESPRDVRVLGPMGGIEAIDYGRGVCIADFLRNTYGGIRWRKMKGIALIEDDYGYFGNAEIHWYEAHGIRKVRWKVKRPLE